MATHSSILAWEIPSEEPGGPQSMGSQEPVSTEYARHLGDKQRDNVFSLKFYISSIKDTSAKPKYKKYIFFKTL